MGGAGAPLPASALGRTPTSLGLSFPICSNGSAHGGPCGEEGESMSLAVRDSPRWGGPCGFGAPLAPPSPPSAFWKVHLPPTQPRCPGDTVTVVTVKGGPVDEHKRGLAQATHRLCKVLGGEGQGWGHLGGKRSGPPPQGPSWRRHHCGGCRDRGCMGSRGS